MFYDPKARKNDLMCLLISDDLKGHDQDPRIWKGTPLRLLPPEFALEDSCRLLITLALIGGHLEGVSTWDDIQKIKASPQGVQVRIKEASLELPILHATKEGRPTTNPLQTQHVRKWLIRLAILAGLARALTR
jgi:hypothetical protein